MTSSYCKALYLSFLNAPSNWQINHGWEEEIIPSKKHRLEIFPERNGYIFSFGRSRKNNISVWDMGMGVKSKWEDELKNITPQLEKKWTLLNSLLSVHLNELKMINDPIEHENTNGINHRQLFTTLNKLNKFRRGSGISRHHVFFIWTDLNSAPFIGAFCKNKNPVYINSENRNILVPNSNISYSDLEHLMQETHPIHKDSNLLLKFICENHCVQVPEVNSYLITGNEIFTLTCMREKSRSNINSQYILRNELKTLLLFLHNTLPIENCETRHSSSKPIEIMEKQSDDDSEATVLSQEDAILTGCSFSQQLKHSEIETHFFTPSNDELQNYLTSNNDDPLNVSLIEQEIVQRSKPKKSNRFANLSNNEEAYLLQSPLFQKVHPAKINSPENSKSSSINSKMSRSSQVLDENPKRKRGHNNTDSRKRKRYLVDLVEESPLSQEGILFQEDCTEYEPSSILVMFTGLEEDQVEQYSSIIRRLGGQVATELTNIREVTHLITDRIRRTTKFLCAVSVCPHILNVRWIDACDFENRFVAEKNFMLKDLASERKFDFQFKTTFQRRELAALQGKQVFSGLKFYLTENTIPGPDQLAIIIECGGGKICKQIEGPKTIVIATPPDMTYLRSLGKRFRVYVPEFIFRSCLLQRCDFEINNLKI